MYLSDDIKKRGGGVSLKICAMILGVLLILAGSLMAGPGPGSEDGPIYNIDPEMYFLVIANSPRAAGMGGCVINMVGDQSALYNPGALGVYHLDKNISFSAPFKTDWLPRIFGDLELKTYNLSAGASLNQIMPDPLRKFNVGIGVAWSRIDMDYGDIVITDVTPDTLGSYSTPNEASLYTFSVAADYYVRVGVGYTMKKIKSKLDYRLIGEPIYKWEADVDAHDIGIYAEFPLGRFINPVPRITGGKNKQRLYEITPSIAYVKSNSGDDITYEYRHEEDQIYPSPETSRLGFSLYGAAKIGNATLAAINICRESETYNFQNDEKFNKWGLELSVLDIAFIRYGGMKDDPLEENGRDLNSYGIGFSLHGAITWLIEWDKLHLRDNILGYVLKNIDLRVDYAEYTGNATQALDDTSFFKVSLSL
jgi:hypothetical protein